jgi:hypothetical protein
MKLKHVLIELRKVGGHMAVTGLALLNSSSWLLLLLRLLQ